MKTEGIRSEWSEIAFIALYLLSGTPDRLYTGLLYPLGPALMQLPGPGQGPMPALGSQSPVEAPPLPAEDACSA